MPRLSSRTPATVLAAALLLATPALAAAQEVLFDNGAPDQLQGFGVYGASVVANDFTLSSTSSLDSFAWYAIRIGTGGPASLSGGFTWRIFADAAGTVGSELFGGTVVGATGTKTAYDCCDGAGGDGHFAESYLFEAALGGTTLGPGTYWLALSDATMEGANSVFWATSDANLAAGNQHERDVSGAWVEFGAEGAFSVSGVTATPEPASLALLGTGLVGLGAFARRRARRSTAG